MLRSFPWVDKKTKILGIIILSIMLNYSLASHALVSETKIISSSGDIKYIKVDIGFNFNYHLDISFFRNEIIYLREQCGVKIIKFLYPARSWTFDDETIAQYLDILAEEGMNIIFQLDPSDDSEGSIEPNNFTETYVREGINFLLSNQQWTDMTKGIIGANELCYPGNTKWGDYTSDQMKAFMWWEKEVIKSILQNSSLNNIPILFTNGLGTWTENPYHLATVEVSDIPCLNLYATNLDELITLLDNWENNYVKDKKYWITEFNTKNGVQNLTSDMITKVVEYNCDHLSFYIMNSFSEITYYQYAFFQANGEPKTELEALAETIRNLNLS